MNEREQQPERAEQQHGPWEPDEQVGDIYEVEINDDGQIESAEKLDSEPGPQIWVGSLADYNNGILHGDWIDAAREADEIHDDINAMLRRSPTAKQHGEVAEEFGIFDYDGFGDLRIDEYESIGYVARVARGIAEHGLAFAAYADVMQDEGALDGFEDDYIGHHASLEEYASEMVEDLGYEQTLDDAVPDSIRPYIKIDVEQLARDMDYSGDVHVLPADDGGVWIFQAR